MEVNAMPRNPDKTPCSVDGCRAWAIRGSDPPLCSPHRTGAARSEQSAAACTEHSVAACPEHNVAACPESDGPVDAEREDRWLCSGCDLRWLPPQGTPLNVVREYAERVVRGVGAPPGNQNRRTHGFYARALSPQEQTDLDSLAGDASLDAEIAIARVALRRVLDLLSSGVTPGPDPSPLTADEIARLTGLAIRGTSAVSRLLRTRQTLDLATKEAEKRAPTCSLPLLLMLGQAKSEQ